MTAAMIYPSYVCANRESRAVVLRELFVRDTDSISHGCVQGPNVRCQVQQHHSRQAHGRVTSHISVPASRAAWYAAARATPPIASRNGWVGTLVASMQAARVKKKFQCVPYSSKSTCNAECEQDLGYTPHEAACIKKAGNCDANPRAPTAEHLLSSQERWQPRPVKLPDVVSACGNCVPGHKRRHKRRHAHRGTHRHAQRCMSMPMQRHGCNVHSTIFSPPLCLLIHLHLPIQLGNWQPYRPISILIPSWTQADCNQTNHPIVSFI